MSATELLVRDLIGALVEAEMALAVKASLRDSEQARVERALQRVRASIARATGEPETEVEHV